MNGLGVRGNYVCSLVMSVIYIELGGRKGKGFKVMAWKETYGGKAAKSGAIFMGDWGN